ncbi:OB-fold protein [Flagellimonas sp.]|uniref:OB-fold protein n=1 Tax=Flagellimonas sp. TaxID=2058762 RepID=UPI003B5A3DA5
MISKRQLTVLTLMMLTLIILIMSYRYLNPEQRNIAEETARYEMQASELFNGFNNEKGKVYIDQVVGTSGKVTDIDKNSVILDDKVQVNFINAQLSKVEKGKPISVKGRCIGYDDLLELVKIDQATITN